MRNSLEFFLFVLVRWVTAQLSFRGTTLLGGWLGSCVFHLLRFRRTITTDNLRHAFPGKAGREIDNIAHDAYRNYGITVLQMLWADKQDEETLLKTVRMHGRSVFANAYSAGRGLVLLSGHFGGWEMIIRGLRLHLGMPMNIIVQRQRNPMIDRVIDEGRRRHGNVTIPMGPSAREALRTLKEGHVIAMLADQSGPKESVFVPFFGRPAATHRGAAAFALRTKSPIVMVFLLREPDGVYRTLFEEVNYSDLSGYSDANIDELTRRHVEVLERYIRRYPDHWLWMHKRWKHTAYYEELAHPEGEKA
jgi:KDO2-lipid IV(A) lauroyltransferase